MYNNLLFYLETNVSVQRRSFLYLGTLLDYFFPIMHYAMYSLPNCLFPHRIFHETRGGEGTLQNYSGTIRILRQQRDWVGGVKKWQFLLTFSTISCWSGGWVRKSPKMCWRNIGMIPDTGLLLTAQILCNTYCCAKANAKQSRGNLYHLELVKEFVGNSRPSFSKILQIFPNYLDKITKTFNLYQ